MKKNTVGYIILVGSLIATSTISLNLFLRERTAHDRLDIHNLPLVIEEWRGKDIPMEEYVYRILETRNMITREYVNPSGDRISLFIIYSETNRSVFHPPEVCMVGGGLAIVDKQTEKVQTDRYKFLTNKLYAEKGSFKELVLYSYKAGNLYTENFYLQQVYLAFHQLFGRQVPGATVRVSMQLRGDERETLAMLKTFLAETVKILESLT